MGISFAKRNTKEFNGNFAVDGVVRLERNAQCDDMDELAEFLSAKRKEFKSDNWAIMIWNKKGHIECLLQNGKEVQNV